MKRTGTVFLELISILSLGHKLLVTFSEVCWNYFVRLAASFVTASSETDIHDPTDFLIKRQQLVT